MKAIALLFPLISIISKNNNGHIGAAFYNFDDFTVMDYSMFKSDDFIHVKYIYTDKITDFIFNYGISVSMQNTDSIAFIKYKTDFNFYSITPATSWEPSESGNDIIFYDKSVTFTIPRSQNNIGPFNETPQLMINFLCENIFHTDYSSLDFKSPYFYILEINSNYEKNCPYVFSPISFIFWDCKDFIGPFTIGLGLILALGGLKYLRITFCICTFLTISLIMFVSFHWYIDVDNPYSSYAGILVAVCLVSIFISLINIKFDCIGIMCLGISFGATIVLILYDSLFHSLFSENILYCMCGIFGIIGAVYACKIHPIVIIFSTPLIGSYLMVHSFGSMIGGFPNESIIYTRIKAGMGFQNIFYAYLAAILIIGFLSLLFQVRIISKCNLI